MFHEERNSSRSLPRARRWQGNGSVHISLLINSYTYKSVLPLGKFLFTDIFLGVSSSFLTNKPCLEQDVRTRNYFEFYET